MGAEIKQLNNNLDIFDLDYDANDLDTATNVVEPVIEADEDLELDTEVPDLDISNTNIGNDIVDDSDEGPYTLLVKNFFEYNDWEWEDGLMKEDSPEAFNEILLKIIEENAKPEYANPVVEQFDKYVKGGGDPKQFLNTYYNEASLPPLDLNNKEHQKYVVFEHLKNTTRWSEDKIKKHIEKLERLEDLGDEAKEAYDVVNKIYEEKRNSLLQEQENEAKKQQQQLEEYVNNVKGIIAKGTAEDLGFDLTPIEKKKFAQYVLGVDPKTGKTAYAEFIEKTPNAQLKLALLAFKGAASGKLPTITKNDTISKLSKKLEEGSKTLFSKNGNKANIKKSTGSFNPDIYE